MEQYSLPGVTISRLGNLDLSESGKVSSQLTLYEYLAFRSSLGPLGEWIYTEREKVTMVDINRVSVIVENINLQSRALHRVRAVLQSGERIDPMRYSCRYRTPRSSFLALQGLPTFDGSWFYIDLFSGVAHSMSHGSISAFVEIAQLHEEALQNILKQYKDRGIPVPGESLEVKDNAFLKPANSTPQQKITQPGSPRPNLDVPRESLTDAIKHGSVRVQSDGPPRFAPSVAAEPIGFVPLGSHEEDVQYALGCASAFQSFYNDLDVVRSSSISDDVVGLPSFDEQLYCSLVREMHRYSLAEIADNQSDLAKKNAGLGAMVGSLIGVISGNIFAPFLGHSYGRNLAERGKKVEEFLPDPNLLFYQDENSYLSWSRGQVASPRLRRLIFDRRVKPDGKVFFRLVPAIVTSDSVFPVQLFKVDSKTYFYRPFSAGINRNQPNYDSVKLQRRYFHLRGEGAVDETGLRVAVTGGDVEEYETKIFSFKSPSLSYFYVDFKIHPGSLF